MTVDYDVIVIGAGFSGLIAAREIGTRGKSVLLLEGRDRIGGRTYSITLHGEVVEMGGTAIHWTEPHIWAEITRYGLESDVMKYDYAVEHYCTPTADGLKWVTADEHYKREKRLVNLFCEPSREVFPRPYDPLYARDAVAKWDISVEERIAQLALSADDEAFLRAYYIIETAGPLTEGGFLSILRWYALGGHDYDVMVDNLFDNVLRSGTSNLHNLILDDSGAELRLSTVVSGVATGGDVVTVTAASGDKFTASAVVVATPSGCWADISFTPALSADRLRISRDRALAAPRVSSTKAVIKGETREFFILPEVDHPIGDFYSIRKLGEDTQLVQLDQAPAMKTADRDEIVAAIKSVLPHVEVLELHTEKYYDDDPMSRGGWPMFHPGVLSREEPMVKLARPEGRVIFAGADVSTFWGSYIDGAVESGLRAGRQVRELLGR
jgi:monoamine oxidase